MVVEKTTSFRKWAEPLVDLTSFGVVELFSLMSRQVEIMHPYAVGAMTASTAHALSIAAAKNFFNPQTTEGHIAVTVMGLAISTIALPYIIGNWAIHTAIRLNFETAVRTAVTSLVVKSTIFTLYTIGKSLFDQHSWQTPKQLKDLDDFGSSQLKHVKAFFMDHTDQRKGLTLALQHALSVPLGACSEIGDGWTKESLEAVQRQNLDFLTVEQMQELNTLYMQHNLSPKTRNYVKGELPAFPKSLTGLSRVQLTWVHLIAQLSDTMVSPELAKQFYENGFPPAKSEWIDWSLPLHLDVLSKNDFAWIRNDLVAHPEKWKALDLETQRELKNKGAAPFLIFPHTVEDVEKLTSSELKECASAFQKNEVLKKEFPLGLRRVLANRLEDKLGFDADLLFCKGEERVEPSYLIGRMTTKQAIALGILVIVVAVPAIGAIGGLFYGASTPRIQEPAKESKNQNEEFSQLPVDDICLPIEDPCLSRNCSTPSFGSEVFDHSLEVPKQAIQVVDPLISPHSKVDRGPDNFLMIPSDSKDIDHPFPSYNITVIDKSWVPEAPALKVHDLIHPKISKQRQEICPDNNCLMIPLGSEVIDHPIPVCNLTVTDKSWVPEEPAPAFPDLMIPEQQQEVKPSNHSLILDPNLFGTCEAPSHAVPHVFEPFTFPQPKKVVVTQAEESSSFSILDNKSYVSRGGTRVTYDSVEPHYDFYSGLVWPFLGILMGLGFHARRREPQTLEKHEEMEIVPLERDDRRKLVAAIRGANHVAFDIVFGNERIQAAFDLSNPITRELYRMFQEQPIALEGQQHSALDIRAFVGIQGNGIRQVTQLDLSHRQIARFVQGLVRQARAQQPVQALEVSQPRRSLALPLPEVRLPPLDNTHNRFPLLSISPAEVGLNDSLQRSLLLEESSSDNQKLQESRYVAWSHFIGENGHPAKMRKYRVVLDEYSRVMRDQFKQDLFELFLRLQEYAYHHPQNALYTNLFRAVETLMSPIDPRREYLDASTQRYTFVQALRNAIISMEYQAIEKKNEKTLSVDDRFCRDTIWILSESFFRPEIYNYLKDMTDLFVYESRTARGNLDDTEKVTVANFVSKIDGKNTDIKRAPKDRIGKSGAALQYQKACGALGCEDFIGTKNTPHLRNKYVFRHGETGKTQVVDYFRHGCPVLPGQLLRIAFGAITRFIPWWMIGMDGAVRSGESVAPEYEQFLRAKAARKEGDLYVNHQRRTPGGFENEWDRVEAIEGLQSRHPNEFVLTQSVEGTLFGRTAPFAEITKFSDLIDAFIATYTQADQLGDNAQNMLPRIFWNEDRTALKEAGVAYLERLKGKLQHLHAFFFDSREEINFDGASPTNSSEAYALREWQIFIELCYSFMRKDLIFHLSELSGFKVTSMKDICKDKLDRGGNEAKNEDEIAYYMMGDLRDERFEETLYQLLGPPILVKKKEAIPGRLKPGLALSEFLHSMPVKKKQEMKKLAATLFHGWQMQEVRVGKQSGQEAFPTKETARTKEEYRALLLSQQREPLEVEEILRRKFEPTPLREARDPEEVYAFLEAMRPKAYVSTAEMQVQENVKPYMKESKINEKELFAQIDKDLKRSHGGLSRVLLNEKSVESAADLFEALSQSSENKEEVLGWMTLIQQGLFAGIQEAMQRDLGIGGLDTGFQMRGHGSIVEQKSSIREYHITTEKKRKPTLVASSYYELISGDLEKVQVFREAPYGVLKTNFQIDFEFNRAISFWKVDEVIKS